MTKHDYVKTKHDYVKTNHDYVKTKHDYVKTKHDYAKTKHDYVKTFIKSISNWAFRIFREYKVGLCYKKFVWFRRSA